MGKFQENLSRPGIIDARARYRAEARRLRNTAIVHCLHAIPLTVYIKFYYFVCGSGARSFQLAWSL